MPRLFAPAPFRYPPQTGVDYPFGWQHIADDTLAGTFKSLGLMQSIDGDAIPIGGAMRLTSDSGEQYKLIAGVIRNFNDGQGWRAITAPETPDHWAANLGTVSTNAGVIAIDVSALGGVDVVSCVAVPDEVLSRAGFTVGASVTKTTISLFLEQPHLIADYISYNGSSWSSAGGVFTFSAFGSAGSGILTLTHKQVEVSQNGYCAQVSSRGDTYSPGLEGVTTTTTQVKFFARSGGALATAADANMKAYVFRGPSSDGVQTDFNPLNVHQGTYPGGNIWLMAVLRTK